MGLSNAIKWSELGHIPADWDILPIEEVAQIKNGLTYSPSNVSNNGTLVLRSSNIQDDRLSFINNVFVNCGVPEKHKVEEGDILVCVRNGSRNLIGKCALIDEKADGEAFGAFMAVLRSDISDYLIWQFRSSIMQKQINEHLGATINQITNSSLKAFKVILPSSTIERDAIAQALSDADALIASLEKLIEKNQKIKSALMRHHFFEPKKERNGYLRLGEVAKIYQSETISNSKMSNFGYPVYGANGRIGFFHKYNHEDWQVTITCRGSTCGTVGRTVERSWITGNAMVINTDEQESVYKPYLYHYLCSVDFSDLITGTGQPQIVREPLRNIQIMLPDLDEQKEIASQLEELDELQSRLKDRLNKAKKVKVGMMQELLTGKTRLI